MIYLWVKIQVWNNLHKCKLVLPHHVCGYQVILGPSVVQDDFHKWLHYFICTKNNCNRFT